MATGLTLAIMKECQVDELRANRLKHAARRLWDVMSELGWVEPYGGEQSQRVMPQGFNFIREVANLPPDRLLPFYLTAHELAHVKQAMDNYHAQVRSELAMVPESPERDMVTRLQQHFARRLENLE